MFDRNKPTDEVSASSAQGIERRAIEGSLRQESSSSVSIRGPEQAGPGLSSVQNRQGYCNCCHVHYSNLEQHVFSSQHRHFTMYCRNRTGTTTLMERFLQDVLQHHPHRYHDNRPTYDEMPFPISPMAPQDVFLLPEEEEKEVVRSIREMPGTDSESIVKSCTPSPCRSQEGIKSISVPQTFIQKLKMGQEHVLEISRQTLDICSSEKKHTLMDGTQIANSSHDGQFTDVSPVSHHLRSTPLCHSSPVNPVIAKNIRYAATSNLIPNSRYDHIQKDVCHKDGSLNTNPNPVLASVHPKNPSFSCQRPTCSQGNTSYIISGQPFFKLDGLQSQDETLVSDFYLRDLEGTSNSLSFGASPHLTRYKDMKVSRVDETSVDGIIEEVILKYCHAAPPNELSCKDEESNSSLNISSLLDHSSLEGSEISFDCEAPFCSGAGLPKAATKDIEFLKEVQVNLEDRNYGTQLSSVLKGGSVEQTKAAKQDIIIHNEEPVLPALPHVPPSFVGKTWSQIMYEDDIKIEALVRDFKEGRFHCHFNSEPSANCTGKGMRKKKQKDERKSDIVTGNRTETSSIKALPKLNDAISDGSDFDNLLASDTLCNPQILQMPRKRTWRLASRCQVVKVSHGTQTSLVNYPIVKRKIIRKEPDPPDQKASIIWSENERISNMKTRLCALKLPEAYTKIMSPLQPKTVVYVLSCPEIKQYKGKPIDVPKMRRNHSSTDSKDSVRYRYKQCSLKYYDPLTNRILKTPPKSTVREKAKKPSHVRQLFRSLSLDANTKKLSDTQKECTPSKFFNWPGSYSSSATFLSDPVKGNDMNSSLRTDGASISTERSDFPVFVHSEKSYKHVVLSPLNSHQSQIEDVRLTPVNSRVAKTPLKSIRSERLERENSKTVWKRKEGTSREPGFSKKASGPMSVNCGLVRRGSRVASGKQASRTKKQKKEQIRRELSSCAQKSSSVFSIHRHQTRKPTLRKHLKKEKLDAKKLKVRRKPRTTFLNSTVTSGITEKRQKITAGSFPKKPELASSKVRSWEMRISPAL
ncbi:DBF4-type zinc finger-containing protein 2 isoform X1 [Chelonoidis abingdonii]|uniref:DBF4-type zinc finger-containing protein 2 isoform X1 n=3 Tax=Chelonoidis abingdonii TaxID=106734 RepID=UPI0013F18455|nr:DBF4-type zinc finger-containing protein 2 isoform X1 [Chelonoidis abingdonii]XP_032635121.1 DBF4-type zinc finger-containing protein 2 isoform X1 [Chelonoidis abingdonii]